VFGVVGIFHLRPFSTVHAFWSKMRSDFRGKQTKKNRGLLHWLDSTPRAAPRNHQRKTATPNHKRALIAVVDRAFVVAVF
jgi:hypothetical protein